MATGERRRYESAAIPACEVAACADWSHAVRRVVEIDPQTDSRWERFVAAHPDGLIYHHPAWLQVLERAYGHHPVCLACEDSQSGELSGILPLFRTRGLLTKRRLSSLPHTPVAGPLAQDDDAMAALLGAAVERVRARPGARLQVKAQRPGLERLLDGLHAVPWEATYALRIPESVDHVRFGDSRNHARIKWAVNKAVKLGVKVRRAETPDDLRAWYALYLNTMRWHAVPPRPYRFFQVAWERLRPAGLLRLLLAEQHLGGATRLLAGSIFVMWRGTVFYAFNGRRPEDLALRPNDIIQWQAIHDACREGFRFYDLGEVEEHQQSLAEFKSKWGAEPKRLYRYYYPATDGVEPAIINPDSHSRRLASQAWRRLPLNVTAALGDWIYRYL